MALGGFLAGLSQASNQLPQAIQNRQMLGVREEEAEARKLAAQRASENDIFKRLQYMAETGETEAVQQAVANMPEGQFPGLGQALVGAAGNVRLGMNREVDKEKVDLAYKQAQLTQLQNPGWKPVPGSQFMQRTDPETGLLETVLGPSRDKPPVKTLEVIASSGQILKADGSVIEIMDRRARDAIMESAKTKNPVAKIAEGQTWFRDGTSRPWTNSEQDIFFNFEKRKEEASFGDFKAREDYKNKIRLNQFEKQSEIRLTEDQKKNEWKRLEKQSETVQAIFNTTMIGLQKGFVVPERAIDSARQKLELAQVEPQKASLLLQEWEPIYNAYAFQFDLTSAQAGLVMENRGIQVSADKIYELLKDDEVKRHIGVFKGRFEDFERSFKGGKDTPQSVVNFRFELNNMVDAVRRARTGAAISETETQFYDDLLGTTRFDAGYLQGIMESLVTSIDSQSEELYLGLWQQKYQYPATDEDRAQIREKLLYKTNIGAPDPKIKLKRVSVGQVKGNNNGN